MVHEEMAHRILLEKMGVENYSPKFLKVVQPAGLNKETNQKGKRYLFLKSFCITHHVAGRPEVLDAYMYFSAHPRDASFEPQQHIVHLRTLTDELAHTCSKNRSLFKLFIHHYIIFHCERRSLVV